MIPVRDVQDGTPSADPPRVGSAGPVTEEGSLAAGPAAGISDLGQLRMLSRIVQQVGEGVAVTDNEARILYANAEFARMHHCDLDDLHGGRYRGSDFYSADVWAGPVQGLMHDALTAGIGRAELNRLRADGSVFPASVTLSLLYDDGGSLVGRVLCVRDVTAARDVEASLREANARLERLASTDQLTGLPNRGLFTDRLEQTMALARREPRSVALLFLDVDRFKSVNDTLGHQYGDEVLVEVARRLVAALRECDTVARLGGDEFAVLLGGSASPEDAAGAAQRLLDALRPGIAAGRTELFVGASIGIALWPEDCASEADLLEHADVAMYRAKASGGNRFEMFRRTMTIAARERLSVQAELSRAVDAGELRLRYDPQVELATGRVTGVEAVAWWDHPSQDGGAPASLPALAEETGLSVRIGAWALQEACQQAARWRSELGSPLTVGVGVSARQLDDPVFGTAVRDVLAASHLPAVALELQVPEAAARPDAGTASALEALARLGVRLAVDGFGTGCSSLASLCRRPLHRVRLDPTFVAGVTGPEGGVVGATVALARAAGLETVAGGVSDERQRDALAAVGCVSAQGPLWTEPLAAADLAGWITARRRPRARK